MKTKAIEIVENPRRRAICEKEMRYDVKLHGIVIGELYYNMRGYQGYLPTPDGGRLNIGEKSIGAYKREATRLNREWAEAGEIAYYKITLTRTTPRDDSDTAKQIAAMRNTEYVVCKPFQSLPSEAAAVEAVRSGSFRDYVIGKAIEAGKIAVTKDAETDDLRRVQGIMRVEETDYWKK